MKSAPKTAAERCAEYEAWYDEQERPGLEDVQAGRVVSDEEVRHHFDRRFKQQQKQAV